MTREEDLEFKELMLNTNLSPCCDRLVSRVLWDGLWADINWCPECDAELRWEEGLLWGHWKVS